MRQLTSFAIQVREADFVLHLEVDGGETIELSASEDQLEAVINTLADLLDDEDDEDDDRAEVYQKPLG